jgi:hypothetical protein
VKQAPDPISMSIGSILAGTRTPENAKDDDESTVTGSSTGLRSPTRGRNPRTSFASPTQASNARRGIVSPSASTFTSPLTSPVTSPVTSSRPSSIPRFPGHRKNRSVDSTLRATRSPSPLDGISRPTASPSERLKSPEQRRTQDPRTKTSQHRRARSHDQNIRLKPSNESDEFEIEPKPEAGQGSGNGSVDRHDSHQVQQDTAPEAGDQPHEEDGFDDVEVTNGPARCEKLDGLPRLVLSEEENSNYNTVQGNTISPIKEEESEELSETHKSPSVGDDEAENSLLQDEIQALNNQLIDELENDNATLRQRLQAKEKDIEAHNNSLSTQGELVEALNETLRIRSEELIAATGNARTSDETLGKLRNDFTQLISAAKHVLRRNIDTKLDPNILKNLSENTNLGPEARELYTNFVQIVQKLEFRLRTLSAQSHKHHKDSTARKERLQVVEKKLTETREREKLVVSEGQKAKEELAIWKQRYEDEQKLKEKAQRDYTSFKKTAEEMYQPDLEKKNKQLQSELMVTLYENTQLQQHVEQYKACVSNWEDEHKIMKERAEKEHSELENEIARQKAEMLLYVKEYHDKAKETSHWNLEGLQERISELEREHEATISLLNTIKQEKATLEKVTIPDYLERIVTMQEEHKAFKDEWALNHYHHHTQSTSPSTQLTAGLPIPRLAHPLETAQRDARIKKLRHHQIKLRESHAKTDAYTDSMLEKARKSIIKPELYEKGGWREFEGKSSWQIWDGDSWMVKASKRDFQAVEKLREKGWLPREVGNRGEEETTEFPKLAEFLEGWAGGGEGEGGGV